MQINKIIKSLDKYYKKLSSLNNNKLLAGLAMLILNIGSKYIEIKLSKSQEAFVRNKIGREILIFTIIFVGTHDIVISILMTAALIILSNTIFNEKSKYCLMPDKYKNLHIEIDTNKDEYISEEEIEKARNILHKANLKYQSPSSTYLWDS